MARTKITEGQALWQPGGTKEDCRFREGNRHLHLAYEEEEEERSAIDSAASAGEPEVNRRRAADEVAEDGLPWDQTGVTLHSRAVSDCDMCPPHAGRIDWLVGWLSACFLAGLLDFLFVC